MSVLLVVEAPALGLVTISSLWRRHHRVMVRAHSVKRLSRDHAHEPGARAGTPGVYLLHLMLPLRKPLRPLVFSRDALYENGPRGASLSPFLDYSFPYELFESHVVQILWNM